MAVSELLYGVELWGAKKNDVKLSKAEILYTGHSQTP
jgi:hypothetical protein